MANILDGLGLEGLSLMASTTGPGQRRERSGSSSLVSWSQAPSPTWTWILPPWLKSRRRLSSWLAVTSVPVALHEGLDHLSKHPSLPGVFGGRGVEGFELVAYPLWPSAIIRRSRRLRRSGGCDRQQTEGAENKPDNAPRESLYPCLCSGCCEEGTGGSRDSQKNGVDPCRIDIYAPF